MSTLDEWGSRQRVIPAEVRGPLRRRRDLVSAILLCVFLGLPWIKINGLQAVLLNIPERRFELFGVLFGAHDAPLIFFVLLIFVLALAAVTALWGRVWCGWACPQTVFIEAVYRRLEIWIEGDYITRRRMHAGPWNFKKVWRVSAKWLAYLLLSSLFAHSFIAYFTGGTELIAMIRNPPESNWSYFLAVSSVTALLLFNFGWFREQFCIVMCPYGRFQSVLMDPKTVTIAYDQARGEPRKAGGDCVACNRCVQVCPTGIDIRHGLQMECIGCTACIDACNVIMKKVGKPEGLIRYKSQVAEKPSFRRPRVIAYASLLLAVCGVFAFGLSAREPFSVTVLRATDVPFQRLSEGQILNHFKVHLMNQSADTAEFHIELPETDGKLSLTKVEGSQILKSGQSAQVHFFIRFPAELLDASGSLKFRLRVRERYKPAEMYFDLVAVGPYSSGS